VLDAVDDAVPEIVEDAVCDIVDVPVWLAVEVTVVEADVISHPKKVPAICRLIMTLKAPANVSHSPKLSAVITKLFLKHPILLKFIPGNCVISCVIAFNAFAVVAHSEPSPPNTYISVPPGI
jgi:hypothetical protein